MLRKALEILSEGIKKLGIRVTQLERLHNSDEQFGILSAWRSEYSINENKDRTTNLVEELGLYGYTYTSAVGVWEEQIGAVKDIDFEKSFFIYDIDFDTLWLLADMFEQTAFIFKPSNGPIAKYNIKDSTIEVLKDMSILPNQPRVQEKKKRLDEGQINEVYPHTMIRDTEINYYFDSAIPFDGTPIEY